MSLDRCASIKVCVFGSGSFGTALGTVIARNGFTVTLLTRRQDVASSINTRHVNPHHLSDSKLPPLLSATTCAEEALAGASFIVHSIPVQSTDVFLEPLRPLIPAHVPFVSTSKGLHSDTLEMMAELVPRVLGRCQPMAFLSGPTFAQELMDGNPSGAIIAAEDSAIADKCAALFHSDSLRIYTTTDVIGVEVGGALKNVYALAAGAIEGMGLGVNPTAFMVTRACTEMNMLAVAMGAKSHTMAGLSGMGDLMLTCMGGASRNKAVGARIGKGESLASILDSRQQSLSGVAEGVATAPAAVKLAQQLGVDAPLASAVASVLAGAAKPREAILTLMQKPRGEDFSAAAPSAEKVIRRQQRLDTDDLSRGGRRVQVWATLAIAEAFALAALLAFHLRRK
eukprot:gnl/TRDRNA2_/TRDRNA2_198639_c0_seq1.p1 gnl/TRDRNA2_/TRDRNA2_198639_c0~~gnl/TRDRNA2_/TRDRNA2_198639_c0_seq1.p1  ORF type:complete len:409 (-),score=63.45 gnl/TRDRNA2_/TRDRNA2_198639_c0_seq1:61-1251(-)